MQSEDKWRKQPDIKLEKYSQIGKLLEFLSMELGIDLIGHGNLLKYLKPGKVTIISVFQEENHGYVEDEAESRIRETIRRCQWLTRWDEGLNSNSC